MPTSTRMLRRMPVWRTVATSRRAALLAGAQMNPAISSFHALFANSLFRLFNVSNPIDVNAYFCWHAASIQFADDSLLACVDTLSRVADHTLKLVLRNYLRPATPASRRRKTIACQCFGK